MDLPRLMQESLHGQEFVERLSLRVLDLIEDSERSGGVFVDTDLPNQAEAEATAMRDYRGRYIFELLQNASDAIAAAKHHAPPISMTRSRVRIELTDTALVVANDGMPFDEAGVDSMHRYGQSSKDPNKSIGHKGIGFKSVLEITDAPEIFSSEVQFRFDRAMAYSKVRELVGPGRTLHLPLMRFVFPYTIDEIQSPDRELVRALLHEQRYSTVIRLPFKSGKQDDIALRLHQDVELSLLLFLGGIDELLVVVNGEIQTDLRREVSHSEVGYAGVDLTLIEHGIPVERWLLFEAPEQRIDSPEMIEELQDKTWERIKHASFALALRLDEDGQLRSDKGEDIFVYFPTKVTSGLRYRVHADFYLDAARKHIDSTLRYNRWLIERIATFTRDIVVPALVKRFPGSERVVRVLIPEDNKNGFSALLAATVIRQLQACDFVPTVDGGVISPGKVVLLPMGASTVLADFWRFFSSDSLTGVHGGRQFPIPAIEADETLWSFLIHLGAQRLRFEDVFQVLDGRDVAGGPSSYQALYSFLWDWQEALPRAARAEFTTALQAVKCVVTDSRKYVTPHDRLYHPRFRQDTLPMPRAIAADLVHRKAYGDQPGNSPTYRLLKTLSPPVRDYDATEIIRNSIVPLFNEDRFGALPVEQQVEVYKFLFDYWRSRRDGSDLALESLKQVVKVPARSGGQKPTVSWCRAGDVYLSRVWTGDDRLEQVYGKFADAAFLHEIPGLSSPPAEVRQWSEFWQ